LITNKSNIPIELAVAGLAISFKGDVPVGSK
jgi:hypothetical protein